MHRLRVALGIISGTSMDGIDVAAIETDGVDQVRRIGGATYAYPDTLRSRLIDFVREPAAALSDPLVELERDVTDAHTAAALRFLTEAGIAPETVYVAGFHGQTVLHRPDIGFTRQLFDGERGAQNMGLQVVTQFRLADMAAGGQGAPLVPLYHQALARSAELEEPIAVLNLGGVGNITYIDRDSLIAFDTGPASALIDDWVRRHGRGPFDRDGQIARRGHVDSGRLTELMRQPYFALPPPKSLDRNTFHAVAQIVDGMTVEDGAATLTAFTVSATAAARAHMPQAPRRWLVCGGGRLNATLMGGLRSALGVAVDPVEAVGWDGDTLEAECFGYLAVRSMAGLPLSLPTTTGVTRPTAGGAHHAPPPGNGGQRPDGAVDNGRSGL